MTSTSELGDVNETQEVKMNRINEHVVTTLYWLNEAAAWSVHTGNTN